MFIGGVTVTHATLHNIDQIQRLDLHLGDTIVIERSGEVIPYVVEVVKDKRPKGAKPVEAPKKCPECATKVEREALPEETAAYRCVNTACDAFFERQKVKRAKLPEACPVCEKTVEVLDAGIDIYCPNPACPGADEGAAPLVLRPQPDGHRGARRQADRPARGRRACSRRSPTSTS